MARAEQIRTIYATAGAMGIVERGNPQDNLHLLVEGMTGKASVKELTEPEAAAVIKELQKRQGGAAPPPAKAKNKAHTERPGGATSGQQRKVWALMYQLEAADTGPSGAPVGERLCGIIRKELKQDALPRQPFAWVTFKSCEKLIEVLKQYVKNAGKRKVVDDAAGR